MEKFGIGENSDSSENLIEEPSKKNFVKYYAQSVPQTETGGPVWLHQGERVIPG